MLIKALFSKINTIILLVSVFTFGLIKDVLAATIGQRAKAIGTDITSIGGMVYVFALVAGITMVIIGLLGIRKAQQRQDPLGPHVTTLIIGVALSCSLAFVGIFSETMFGSGKTELDKLGL